jgi:GT2 family glycosyltransferase
MAGQIIIGAHTCALMLELSIVIPTLNRLDTLLPCLDSIGRHTAVPHEVIVYANACTDETARQLEARPTVVPMLDSDNRFFTEAVNAGIARARGQYVFLLNDDTLLRRDDWFPFYRSQLELDPRIGVVGPYWKNIDNLPYGWIEPYATLYPRTVFDRLGGLPYLDPSFVLWWSDIYHAYTLMREGYFLRPLTRALADAYVWHQRDGESGDTVRRLRPTLPADCFVFHGKAQMYARLGITNETRLAGYYDGVVWAGEAPLPLSCS